MHSIITRCVVKAIAIYQRTISPDHGVIRWAFPFGVCRYHPTCSQYCKEAVLQHGWKGVMLGLRRVGSCHPFTAGGVDPVPQ